MRRAFPIPVLLAAATACNDGLPPTHPTPPNADAAATSSPSYQILDLGTLGGDVSQATSLNDSGQVAGWSKIDSDYQGPRHAFLWTKGAMQDLGTLGGCCSRADAVNLAGQVAGGSVTAAGEWHAFLWTAGQMQDLGPASRNPTATVHLNDAGQVAWTAGDPGATRAMLWSGGVAQDLGTLGGASAVVGGINQSGAVAGSSDAPTPQHRDAFLWTPGAGMQDLGNLGDLMSSFGLNARGEVVGLSIANPSSPSYHAWVWDGTQLADLGALSSYSAFGYGFAVNNRGEVLVQQVLWDNGTPSSVSIGTITMNQRGIVAGQISVAREVDHAAVWQDGQVTDLGAPNTLGDPASSFPAGINAGADVAGWFGDGSNEGIRHAARWRRVR